VTGRIFFEEVIRENLDIGRPSQVSLESLIDSFVEQLSQVFMLRVFHVGTIC